MTLTDEQRTKVEQDRRVASAKVKDKARSKAGSSIELEEVDPWAERVNGLELANEIRMAIRRHVVLDATASLAMTLWVMLTWVYDSSHVLPILVISSPAPECGKTTALELLCELVRRAVPGSNITPAALYRVIDAARPTLLIDEADTFLKDNDELRGVINSGHTRATAYVLRSVGEGTKQEVRKFSTWCPKTIALIKELPETIARRSIRIRLERKLPTEQIEHMAVGDDRYHVVRRRLARWAQDNEEAAGQKIEVPSSLSNRRGDNWRPLLSIAHAIGGDWPEQAIEAAESLTGKQEQDGIAALLLADIKAIFDAQDENALSSQKIVEALGNREDRPWPEWGRQKKPITAPALAAQLRHFGIGPQQTWIDGQNRRGYRKEQFEGVWDRYLVPDDPDQSPSPVQTSDPARNGLSMGETADVDVLGVHDRLAGREREEPHQQALSSGLAVPQGGTDANGHRQLTEAEYVERFRARMGKGSV
jgi:putative DNA primase/helicase